MISSSHIDYLDYKTEVQRNAVAQVVLEVDGHYEDMDLPPDRPPPKPFFSQYLTENFSNEDGAKLEDVRVVYGKTQTQKVTVTFNVDIEGIIDYVVTDENKNVLATGDFFDHEVFNWLI